MKYQEFLDTVWANAGTFVSKTDVKRVVESMEQTVLDEIMRGGSVSWRGFGKFERRVRVSRKIKGFHSDKIFDVPKLYVMKFTPSSRIKKKIKNA